MEYHKTKDILHVMQLLGHKSIRNTLVYTHLVNFESDEWICKVATTKEERRNLIENGFTFVATRDCWIGNLLGTATPSDLAPGDVATVRLVTPLGVAVPASTPLELRLYRRTGTPGTPGPVIGAPLGAPVQTTAGAASITLPTATPVADVWIEARAADRTALIAAGARP
jgi:hypothetical protein